MQYDSTKFLEWDKSASCEEKALYERIVELVNLQDMQLKGGAHSLLFCLKSLELDIKMKNPLGKVMGYDGETMFSEYRYK